MVLTRLKRWILESKRTDAWKQASHDWKQLHPVCALCDGIDSLEAHDVQPYHMIPDAATKTYDYWMQNFITLCHKDHRAFAHCNDPDCMLFNSQIRELAAVVASYREYCTS
jgi:hypothetical protein